MLRIAVTYENGQIFQHFGHTALFKLYDTEEGSIVRQQLLSAGESGHGALAGLLAENRVDALICGGIGGGARTALAQAGIRLYGGVSGSADDAVNALLQGTLVYNPAVSCGHHHQEHGENGHTCGAQGCGSHRLSQ
ncbi:NifB/NifX family molybdenum-iron cluster-binding protein [Ruminococcus sp.]|uniref:NifB/NifX family molybdenum-iron cluster-binding protein n=1 Tax=Ruminococcus sp. TaxID=41978 RepID=UPI00260C9BFB|nr:NifB/NifX family molybdenum-iron cluster-binding protein [Ruminococcus sp.]MDD7555168.1 NifB/NifX family molybdenum-iron cluster-binding protein [Ruminococcus sp.]